jgi:hypothetical protein
VGIKLAPSLSPNRGIPYGESGIGAPLPSLLNKEVEDTPPAEGDTHSIHATALIKSDLTA